MFVLYIIIARENNKQRFANWASRLIFLTSQVKINLDKWQVSLRLKLTWIFSAKLVTVTSKIEKR